jgi:UDP-N-acetylmuramate--alanine ligase
MLGKNKKIHLIGIKGVGMTALAQVLLSRGCVVTGSDGPEIFFTDEVLKRLNIPVAQKFSADNIPADVDLVISSTAYYFDGKALGGNIEAQSAINRGLPIMTYPQALGQLAGEYQVIAVAGSHGKSTTTAMLGWIFEKIGFDPNVIVGTKVNKWESNARVGKGPHLIVEADEYREAFLNYEPDGAIVTSIDYDHPDYFKTPESYTQAFYKLVDKIKEGGWLVVCGDHEETRALAQYGQKRGLRVLTYGFEAGNKMCRLEDGGVIQKGIFKKRAQQAFSCTFYGKEIAGAIPFPGKQYVLNAGASVASAVLAGASVEEAMRALADFPGTARRLQTLVDKSGYVIIDDYAHHPTAITITLEGVRSLYPNRKIVCVFQPHMFSRTQALLNEFANSFGPADVVGIMEIFPSAREVSGPVKGEDLARETAKVHSAVTYLPTMESGRDFVKQYKKDKNVIVLMGAGDVYEIAGEGKF